MLLATNNSPSIVTVDSASTAAPNVATPATLRSSTSVCPSTSRSALISTKEPNVPPAETFILFVKFIIALLI